MSRYDKREKVKWGEKWFWLYMKELPAQEVWQGPRALHYFGSRDRKDFPKVTNVITRDRFDLNGQLLRDYWDAGVQNMDYSAAMCWMEPYTTELTEYGEYSL